MPGYGYQYKAQSHADGIFIAYLLKLGIAAYLIAYHEFGFRLPSLPFDVAFLLEAVQGCF